MHILLTQSHQRWSDTLQCGSCKLHFALWRVKVVRVQRGLRQP